MQQALTNPNANITPGYEMASITLNDGKTLRGFLRAHGSHDVVLQTRDGKLHPLDDSEYKTVTEDSQAAMAAFAGTACANAIDLRLRSMFPVCCCSKRMCSY